MARKRLSHVRPRRWSGRALLSSFAKLDPRVQLKNPVMFVVEVVSVLTTGLWIQALAGQGEAPAGFILAVALLLWFTVLFANFAEAMAEGRGKAQAEALRADARATPRARRLGQSEREATFDIVHSSEPAQGGRRARRGRRGHPRRRRGDRGHRLGGRERDHRRERAGHPRGRRRPQLGHRRHARALRLDRRAGRRATPARPSSTASSRWSRAPGGRRRRTRSRSRSCSPR